MNGVPPPPHNEPGCLQHELGIPRRCIRRFNLSVIRSKEKYNEIISDMDMGPSNVSKQGAKAVVDQSWHLEQIGIPP